MGEATWQGWDTQKLGRVTAGSVRVRHLCMAPGGTVLARGINAEDRKIRDGIRGPSDSAGPSFHAHLPHLWISVLPLEGSKQAQRHSGGLITGVWWSIFPGTSNYCHSCPHAWCISATRAVSATIWKTEELRTSGHWDSLRRFTVSSLTQRKLQAASREQWKDWGLSHNGAWRCCLRKPEVAVRRAWGPHALCQAGEARLRAPTYASHVAGITSMESPCLAYLLRWGPC
jgi:hypothetical protein